MITAIVLIVASFLGGALYSKEVVSFLRIVEKKVLEALKKRVDKPND